MELALNKSECLVQMSYIGYQKFTNVCTGAEFVVGWGVLEWMASIIAIAIMGTIIIAGIIFAVMFAHMEISHRIKMLKISNKYRNR